MIYIQHRRNSIELLLSTPTEYGIEVDIRSNNGQLIIQHDPFLKGVELDLWLQYYAHKFLILNVKEEGLEESIIKLLRKYTIIEYFFLDQSFPFLIKWAKLGESRCAVRVSEFESIKTALALAEKIDWVWIDCFNDFPLSGEDSQLLKEAGFKLCLVSPELQGRIPATEIPIFAKLLQERSIKPHAICTKNPELWKKYLQAEKDE